MERQPVKSSQIKSVGHDAVENKLEIEFHTGHVYLYHEVTADEHKELMAAESIGKHFGAKIRGVKKYEKVPAEKPKEEKVCGAVEENTAGS
jgi:hypothetical protein